MRIDDWKELLGWATFPPFGEIHKLPPDEFASYYYMPENVREALDTLRKGLQDGYGITHRHIVGEPGGGKTTFVYYLKKVMSRTGDLSKRFSFHILHMNRLQTDEYSGKVKPTDDQREVIEKRVLAILAAYYRENDLEQQFDSLVRSERVPKEQINKLEDFIRDETERFARKLILIIDDIDETPEAEVDVGLHYFYSLLECQKITKWLVVRDTTLDHYGARLLDFIETKFGARIPFPRVDLHGIIAKRISAKNPKGLNPITRDLCVRLLQTFSYDLRQAVGGTIHLFERVDALKGQEYSASFIGQYLTKNYTRAMTEAGVFPNIYYDSESRLFPLEKDVFQVVCLYNEFPNHYIDKLLTYYRAAFQTHRNGSYSGESYLVTFDKRHVDRAVEYLINQRLIVARGRVGGDLRLTTRGEAFAQFVAERLYTAYCRERCDRDAKQRHPMFWVLARRLLSL